MRKFTKKEISLCKQIAERYKKPINIGDWYLFNKKEQFPTLRYYIEDYLEFPRIIPLWTISDCLEFLRKRNFEFTLNYFNHVRFWQIQLWDKSSTQATYSDYGKENKNKTPLEACLKAVLAVLGEEK